MNDAYTAFIQNEDVPVLHRFLVNQTWMQISSSGKDWHSPQHPITNHTQTHTHGHRRARAYTHFAIFVNFVLFSFNLHIYHACTHVFMLNSITTYVAQSQVYADFERTTLMESLHLWLLLARSQGMGENKKEGCESCLARKQKQQTKGRWGWQSLENTVL